MSIRFNTTKMRLLEQVKYLSRTPEKVTNLMGESVTVTPTFPFNPESKTAPETAERWAEYGLSWDERRAGKKPIMTFVTRNNDPFSVTIIDLVVRSEGGRAYKVIDDEGRLFDMREDQLLEALRHVGISPGGRIPGHFVWGLLGSQMRMIFVGGEFHAKMTEQLHELNDYKKMQKAGMTPTEGSLKVGHIYRKRDQSLHLFMGRVAHPKLPKKMFAFMAMPVQPKHLIDVSGHLNSDPKRLAWVNGNNELFDSWHKLTWTQRCHKTWEVENHWRDGSRWRAEADVVLMASPKFEADIGANETELVEHVKRAGQRHQYVDSNKIEYIEKFFAEANGTNRLWFGHAYSSHHASIEASRKVEEAYFADRQAFCDALTWT